MFNRNSKDKQTRKPPRRHLGARAPSPIAAAMFVAAAVSTAVVGTAPMATTTQVRKSRRKRASTFKDQDDASDQEFSRKAHASPCKATGVAAAGSAPDATLNKAHAPPSEATGAAAAGSTWNATLKPYFNVIRKSRMPTADGEDDAEDAESTEAQKKCTMCEKSFTKTDVDRHDRRNCPLNQNRAEKPGLKGPRTCTVCSEPGHLAKSHCKTCSGLYGIHKPTCAERFAKDLSLTGPTAVLGWWFITVVLTGADCPTSFLDAVFDFFQMLGGSAWSSVKRCIAVVERGAKKGNEHLHLLVQAVHARTKGGITALRRRLNFLNPGKTLPLKVQCKPIEDSSVTHVMGYILKDRSQAGFRMRKDEVTTEDELATAQLKYGSKKKLFGAATASLTKSNFMYEISVFAARMCPELIGTAGIIDFLYFMLNSGVYSFAVGWIAGANGFVVNRQRTAAFMRLSMNGATHVHRDDIELVVFGQAETNGRFHSHNSDTWIRNGDMALMTMSQARNSVLGDEGYGMAGVIPAGMDGEEVTNRSASPAIGGSQAFPSYLRLTAEEDSLGGGAATGQAKRMPMSELEESDLEDPTGEGDVETRGSGQKRSKTKRSEKLEDEIRSDDEEVVPGEFDDFIDGDDDEKTAEEARHVLDGWKAENGPTGSTFFIDRKGGKK